VVVVQSLVVAAAEEEVALAVAEHEEGLEEDLVDAVVVDQEVVSVETEDEVAGDSVVVQVEDVDEAVSAGADHSVVDNRPHTVVLLVFCLPCFFVVLYYYTHAIHAYSPDSE
jgi:hypothetical protein